jgi:hypothetical protein
MSSSVVLEGAETQIVVTQDSAEKPDIIPVWDGEVKLVGKLLKGDVFYLPNLAQFVKVTKIEKKVYDSRPNSTIKGLAYIVHTEHGNFIAKGNEVCPMGTKETGRSFNLMRKSEFTGDTTWSDDLYDNTLETHNRLVDD